MPRFPVAFSRRKSTADNLDNAIAGPSFRVLDRSEIAPGHRRSTSNSNGSAHFSTKSQSVPNNLAVDTEDDSLFANQSINRGSANTTNTSSTDNSSRHSNVSTTPSSADLNLQQQQQQQQNQYHTQKQTNMQNDDWAAQNKQQFSDVPLPPVPKSSTSSFLKSAGRTLSFGANRNRFNSTDDGKKVPQTPPSALSGRDRSMTASTVTTAATATPPKIEEQFDLGGDFSQMLGSFDNKRASVATLRLGQQTNGERGDDRNAENNDRPALVPRSLTGNRLNQPAPITLDNNTTIEPSPKSYNSQISHHSTEKLLYSNNNGSTANENAPPVPIHGSPIALNDYSASPTVPSAAPSTSTSTQRPADSGGLRRSSAVFRRRSTIEYVAEAEDEDTVLLKDSLFSVNRFLAGSGNKVSTPPTSNSSRFGRRNDDSSKIDSGYSKVPTGLTSPSYGAVPAAEEEEDNLFDTKPLQINRAAPRTITQKPSPPQQNKVMTPAQFERYRKYKESENVSKAAGADDADNKASDDKSDSEEDNYDDDVDEAEKSRQAAKQRRKQEAHMAVYRQQMMKVTGEPAPAGPVPRPGMSYSMSTPNLPSSIASGPNGADAGSKDEDEDEEVPLAILAAHGFPSRNRAPTRLNNMMSNPNLRAAAAPSFQRPQSATAGGDGLAGAGLTGSASNGRLPAFARNLPQDPYGLINANQREPLNFAGGAPAGGLPPGGLVGVIASEERSRAMRRGSPALDAANKPLPNMSGPNAAYDPMAAIPAHTMYPGVRAGLGGHMPPVMSAGEQAQIQMTQQMQQFMQMQMQFMQMMAGGQRPMSQMGSVQGMPTGMGGMGGIGMNGMGMNGMGMVPDGSVRHSFADNASVRDVQLPQLDLHTRTMSLVQPGNASWMQPPPPVMGSGYAPSIRIQGTGGGYQASIAPSERSNVGLPGRYRPVSNMTAVAGGGASPSLDATPGQTSGTSSPGWDLSRKHKSPSPLQKEATASVAAAADDDDDDEGWAEMKAKRDKKRSMWKSKKSLPSEVGALIS